jgi:hypothetical protein
LFCSRKEDVLFGDVIMTTEDDLKMAGWSRFQPSNSFGWSFWMRKNADFDPRMSLNWYYSEGMDYLTLYPNGRTSDGIIESAYVRRKTRERRRESILFRKF